MIRPSSVALTLASMVKSAKLLPAPPPTMVTPGVPIEPGSEPSMVMFLVIVRVDPEIDLGDVRREIDCVTHLGN